VTNGRYNVEVRFQGGLTTTQEAAFASAAERWSQLISADVPSFRLNGEVVDDVLIFARGAALDGPRGILGQAGPRQVRLLYSSRGNHGVRHSGSSAHGAGW
jgi:hypothetical protein